MGALGAIVLAILVRMVVGDTMQVHVKQPDAEMYHRQDMKRGEFDYGYHVQTVSNQFQHKVKGPDDVTYGCYGYVDPTNRKHLVYYVADRMGYRVIFPNRATKIFTAKLADSLNKLDGAVKGKDYDEKVVEWNNLYMPESCFRLDEILQPAASNQPPGQKVSPSQVQVQPLPAKPVQPSGPALPLPTQYTIPTTPRALVDQTGAGSGGNDPYDDYGQTEHSHTGIYAQETNNPGQRRVDEDNFLSQNQAGGQQQTPQQPAQSWQGSLPDINPANINLDQFNGQIYPIHTHPEEHGADVQTTAGQFSTTQYSFNITQLLAQIEAVNSQVITLNMLLAGMANNPTAYSNANENSCRSVVQLLKTQKRTPQLIYVPILIPYAEGQYNINQPIATTRSEAYRGQQQSNGGCHNCRG